MEIIQEGTSVGFTPDFSIRLTPEEIAAAVSAFALARGVTLKGSVLIYQNDFPITMNWDIEECVSKMTQSSGK